MSQSFLENEEFFFIILPLKKNEDVNPIKASHPRMNPEHHQMKIKECEELKIQGLIESNHISLGISCFLRQQKV